LHFSSVVFASINCSDALITRLFCGARKWSSTVAWIHKAN
jgi:hypothetical protein